MITREHLKQAIDSLGRQDHDIGYALDRMLAAGQIDAPPHHSSSRTSEIHFVFHNQRVPVRAHQFFNEGVAAIEERLLIKFGELAGKQELLEKSRVIDYRNAALDIHEAGLRLLLDHTVAAALERCRSKPAGETSAAMTRAMAVLENIRDSETPFYNGVETGPPFFRGMVNDDVPAIFAGMPFTDTALMQIAEINLDFFSLGFLINTLIKGEDRHLYAVLVNRRIAGLIYLVPHHRFLDDSLEIKYVASVRGRDREPGEMRFPAPKGVGSVLAAGTWLIWKSMYPSARRLWLESEIGAVHFYEAMGFSRRGGYHYFLDRPQGFLLKNILVMCRGSGLWNRYIHKGLTAAIHLQLKKTDRADPKKRGETVQVIGEILHPGWSPGWSNDMTPAAMAMIRRYASDWPEVQQIVEKYGRDLLPPVPGDRPRDPEVLVTFHEFYRHHLENMCHLESPKRMEAIRQVLNRQEISGRWTAVPPRPATLEEIGWVHTPLHIQRLMDTAGLPISSFDIDTQTSERSFEVACLAVGGLFALLDEIRNGHVKRGFSFIRPPGHHAEPERAMGYCLVNNVALAANYLIHRHGLDRIMIVDMDAHHGNGTQAAFYRSPQVLFVSFHQFPFFPGSGNFGEIGEGPGEGYTVNLPLPAGQDDRQLARIVQYLVRPLAAAYKPQMILVSAGFDYFFKDPTSRMRAGPDGYAWMTSLLMQAAEETCNGRICFVLEGGYSYRGLIECALAGMKVICHGDLPSPAFLNRMLGQPPANGSPLNKTIQLHRKYWNFP